MESWLHDIDFLINRHGLSAGQVDPVLYRKIGDFGMPLSEPRGFRQAEELGVFYKTYFDRTPPKGKVLILSTPYLRGEQTKEGFLRSIKDRVSDIQLRDYLGEHRYGGINGMSDREVKTLFPNFLVEQAKAEASGERFKLRFPGTDKDGVAGESEADVYRRAGNILRDAKIAHNSGVRTIIVNTHGTTGRAIQMNILGLPECDALWKIWVKPNNCQVDLIHDGQSNRAIYRGHPDPEDLRPPQARHADPNRIGNGSA